MKTTMQKIHGWELAHLRQVLADQQARIEQLETELEIVRQHADFWQDQAMLDDGASPASGERITGLCVTGELVDLSVRQ